MGPLKFYEDLSEVEMVTSGDLSGAPTDKTHRGRTKTECGRQVFVWDSSNFYQRKK